MDREAQDSTGLIAAELPGLRCFSHALAGSREAGDKLVAAMLERLIAEGAGCQTAAAGTALRVRLYGTLLALWRSGGCRVARDGAARTTAEAHAQWRLSVLPPKPRAALLLQLLGGFDTRVIARIMVTAPHCAAGHVEHAYAALGAQIAGKVMIIEDEAPVSADIGAIVRGLHHVVTGVARSCAEAIALARRAPPDLILADVVLADAESGFDAVERIASELGSRPVIYITAFARRIPADAPGADAFILSKPYSAAQLRGAVSEAMFFASTATLRA